MIADGERRSPSLVAIAALAMIVTLLAMSTLLGGRTVAPARDQGDQAATSASVVVSVARSATVLSSTAST